MDGLEHLTTQFLEAYTVRNTGWHLGACHYKISDAYSIRATDNGKFWAVDNKNRSSVLKELCTLKDFHKLLIDLKIIT